MKSILKFKGGGNYDIAFDKSRRYQGKSKQYGQGVWYRKSTGEIIPLKNRIKNTDGSYVQLNSDGSITKLSDKQGNLTKGGQTLSDTDKTAIQNKLIYGREAVKNKNNSFSRKTTGNRTWDIDTNRKLIKRNGQNVYQDSNGNYLKSENNKSYIYNNKNIKLISPLSIIHTDPEHHYISARSETIDPIRTINKDTREWENLYEIDPSKLNASQYQIRGNLIYDINNKIVGEKRDNKLYSYNTTLPLAKNSEYIGKYYVNPNNVSKDAIDSEGNYRNYYGRGNDRTTYVYNGDMTELPEGIVSDTQGNLYDSNNKYNRWGYVVKTKDGTGFYQYLNRYKRGGFMKLISKAKKGLSFKGAFNKARNNGDRIFWYNGRTYNTMSAKEKNNSKLREQWAQTHRDNSTSGGSTNVQTDIGLSGGWQGVKGANAGRFDSKGNWVRLTQHSDAPVAVRGDNVTQYLDYAPIDMPTNQIKTQDSGTDRNQSHSNLTTGLTVGKPDIIHNLGEVEPNSFADNRQYGGNEDITQFSPWGFAGGPGTYVVSPITPGYSFKYNFLPNQQDNSEYVPSVKTYEDITPEQAKAMAEKLGLKNYTISGGKVLTVTAKAKDKVKPFVEN